MRWFSPYVGSDGLHSIYRDDEFSTLGSLCHVKGFIKISLDVRDLLICLAIIANDRFDDMLDKVCLLVFTVIVFHVVYQEVPENSVFPSRS